MKIVLFFDQIQSGTGGKEGANVELALEKGGVGLRESLQNMAKVIKKVYDGDNLSEVSDYIYK